MEEKRRFQRIDFREAVLYRPLNGQLSNGCLGHDISSDGLRCQVNDFISLGEELDLTISLDREHILELTGRVVWIQKHPHAESYETGLKFINTEKLEQAKRAFDTFLAKR